MISFKELYLMLDCGLSAHSALCFLPLPLVPSARLSSLPSFMPPHISDPLLEGVSIQIFLIAVKLNLFLMLRIYS